MFQFYSHKSNFAALQIERLMKLYVTLVAGYQMAVSVD